ncbi:MAG: hypothetical protein KF749_17575 [Bacteroidetes bacterium]|nr:hypothetical protein [Bacteroidota bacterium]MCW5894141.1 hypothetical protein [Bacteroidota bacterium]
MIFSHIGKIVEADFRAIPNHYPNVSLDAFQVMPNHLHAIITIKETSRRDTTPSCPANELQPAPRQRQFGKPVKGSLSTIIGAYKSGVTIKVQNAGLQFKEPLWQSRFYDHVIRYDVDFFMVQQYISPNPVMWEHDIDNPNAKPISFAEFEKILEEKYHISGKALYMIVNSKKFGRLRIT